MPMSADYLILKRRQQEEHKVFYDRLVKQNFIAGANAEWEIKTSGFIEHQKMNKRFDAIRSADAAALDARRHRLAEMLHMEQMQQEAALAALDMSPEQRKAQMEARAKELGGKREAERQAFVQAAYERQWRLACDPLREKESQAIMRATNAARAYQLGEKMQQLEMEEQENRVFDAMWEEDRLAKLGREEREEAMRKQMDHEQKAVLDKQVTELHEFRVGEQHLAAAESQMMQQQWGLEADESLKVEGLRTKVMQKAHDELDQFNQHRRAHLSSAIKKEKSEDIERLNTVLQKEMDEDRKMEAGREAQAELTRSFAAQMMAQKQELASYENEMEAKRKACGDKAWDKRLAEWGREQSARESLMAQVLQERKLQVETKLELEKVNKVKLGHARVELDRELGRIHVVEAAKNEEAKAVRLEHQALLRNQMKDKEFTRAASTFNKMQEKSMAENAEAQYQAMLSEQMSRTMSNMEKFTNATKGK